MEDQYIILYVLIFIYIIYMFILFFRIVSFFFKGCFSYFSEVFVIYYKNINNDVRKLEHAVNWAKEFLRWRFSDKTLLGRLIAFITVISIFTVYPIMLLLTALKNFLELLGSYVFLPLDILFKDYLLKINFSSGKKATLRGLYRGITIVKINCNRMKSMVLWLLGCFDKIYWANRLIRRWNKIDDFLYNMAIGIEYYIYFLIASCRTGISFYYWLNSKLRYFIFSRSGRENIKIRLTFKYRGLKGYFSKFFQYFVFVLKWFFFCFILLNKNIYFYSITGIVMFFWFFVLLFWEIIKCFIYGLIIIFRVPFILYRFICVNKLQRQVNKPSQIIIKDNLERFGKPRVKDKN